MLTFQSLVFLKSLCISKLVICLIKCSSPSPLEKIKCPIIWAGINPVYSRSIVFSFGKYFQSQEIEVI